MASTLQLDHEGDSLSLTTVSCTSVLSGLSFSECRFVYMKSLTVAAYHCQVSDFSAVASSMECSQNIPKNLKFLPIKPELALLETGCESRRC
jgi:hypothetical protein